MANNIALKYDGVEIARRLETLDIRRHLASVEQRLRALDISGMPQRLQKTRAYYLDCLHHYWRREQFPRNFDQPYRRVPCFIDREGRVCAVAHLLIASGDSELALRIANQANNAYIGQMAFAELDEWVAQSGLSLDELAMIQPTYPGTPCWPVYSPEQQEWASPLWDLSAFRWMFPEIPAGKIRNSLQMKMIAFKEAKDREENANIILYVQLSEQADTRVCSQIEDEGERYTCVTQKLKEMNDKTEPEFLDYLKTIKEVRVETCGHAVNTNTYALVIDGTKHNILEFIKQLAVSPKISFIE